jgi:putative ABC transport system substrate-binding protein
MVYHRATSCDLLAAAFDVSGARPRDPAAGGGADRRDRPVIDRRGFLASAALAILAAPIATRAQPGKTARIGWIALSPGPTPGQVEAFRGGMRERGWTEGQNLLIEPRWGDREGARELAAELVRSKVDVIVTQGPMVFAARAETQSIPVVFGFSGDPVDAKLVTSIARPGGNLTGISFLALELAGKRLELLREVLPRLSRIAILANPEHPGEAAELRESQAAAERLGLTVHYLPVRKAGDFERAFNQIEREAAGAILAFPDLLIMSQAKAIADFASRRRVPAVSGWSAFAVAGNLMTYGPNLDESYRIIAAYVDKILRGAKPADLPVERPTKFDLVLNLKTARALGLTIPPSVLARADQVIE